MKHNIYWKIIFIFLEVLFSIGLIFLYVNRNIYIFKKSILIVVFFLICVFVLLVSIIDTIIVYFKSRIIINKNNKIYEISQVDGNWKYIIISFACMMAGFINIMSENSYNMFFSLVAFAIAFSFLSRSTIKSVITFDGIFLWGNLFKWHHISSFKVDKEKNIILFKIIKGRMFVNEIKCKYDTERGDEIQRYIENRIKSKTENNF